MCEVAITGRAPRSVFFLVVAGWLGSGDLTYIVNPNIEGLDVNCFSILDLRRVRVNIWHYALHPG
jgi:hypothetical protein